MTLANHLLQSTVFAAMAGILTLILRNNHARTRYWIWLTASLKFLVPFSLLVEIGHRLSWPGATVIAQPRLAFVVDEISQPFAAPQVYVNSPSSAASILPTLLLALWICGSTAVLIFWFVRWRSVAAILRTSLPITEGREISALRRMDSQTALIFSPSQMEPGVFGILRPVLSLPSGIAEHLDEAHLNAIFAHELCHVRRRDNLTAALHMLVEAIFWFHPLVWWIGAKLVEERERACDEEVVRLGSDPEVYAETILKICRFYVASPTVCAAGISGSDLGRRIEAIMTGRVLGEMNLGKKLLLGIAGIAAVGLPVAFGMLNQSSSARLQFDAASIKPNVDGRRGGVTFGTLPGGRLRAKYNPALNFIVNAYDVRDYQILNAPSWMSSDFFDIDAKTDGDPTEKQMMQMLQSLLEDRFKLKFHRETRELPVFALTAAKGGVKLQSSKEGSCVTFDPKNPPAPPPRGQESPKFCGNNIIFPKGTGMEWNATKIDMAGVTMAVANIMGRAVIDKTGFGGTFDVHLEWTRDQVNPSEADISGMSIVTALQEQLGLQLKADRGPVEVLVIDHVERPSAN